MKKLIISIIAVAGLCFAADYTVPNAAIINTGTGAAVAVLATQKTPQAIGQIQVITASNFVFVAKGLTTNDWTQVSN